MNKSDILLIFILGTVAIFITTFAIFCNNVSKNIRIEKNKTIIDCQSRGNQIDWCLDKFN